MTRVLVVWEDDYYDGLKSIAKRRMPALAPNPSAVPPTLAFHTSRGNSVPGAPGALDHLVCVVDGDKLRGFLPTVPVIPTANVQEKFDAWHAAASRAWEQKLGEWVAESVPRESVHGVVLRWSRESVLLAGYDRPPIREHLGLDVDHDAVRAYPSGDMQAASEHLHGCERGHVHERLPPPGRLPRTHVERPGVADALQERCAYG